MIAVYLLPVFLATHIYILIWLLRWLCACHVFFGNVAVKVAIGIVFLFCMFAMYIGAYLPHGPIEKFLKLLGYYWYGISLYTYLIIISALLIRLVLKHSVLKHATWVSSRTTFVISGFVCVILILGICISGHINAANIRTTEYEVKLNKNGGKLSELNVVLIADLHLGYNIGPKMMEQMVEKVNACNPDIILVGGDIFDNAIENVEEPEKIAQILQGMQSKYGVYAVYGNHDCQEKIVGGFTFPSKNKKMSDLGMDELVKNSGMCLLKDESILLEDSVYIYGRPDEERPGRDIEERRTEEELMATMDIEKPVIVLEHEPKFLDRLEAAGVDLHLAGHTHDGQMFPLNLTCRIMWENSCGLLQKGMMTSIVTSGVGLYGPNMRVGTIPEVCNVHITFQ